MARPNGKGHHDGRRNGNGRAAGSGNSFSDFGGSQHDHGDGPPPDELPDLGLPDDWQPEFIPSGEDLRSAAIRAVLDENFVLLSEHPEDIAERMGGVFERLRAAITVKGDHQARAIRVALKIEGQYWLASRLFTEWRELILLCFSTARDLDDAPLKGEVCRAWANMLRSTENHRAARQMIEMGLDTIEQEPDPYIRLLLLAERYNLNVSLWKIGEAERHAQELWEEADRLEFRFVRGFVHFALARAYGYATRYPQFFEHSQQALAYFAAEAQWALGAQATTHMIGALSLNKTGSHLYHSHLRRWFEQLAHRTVYPWNRASLYQLMAIDYFKAGLFDLARYDALRAWAIGYAAQLTRPMHQAQHMLGMIQANRGRWQAAAWYLRAAEEKYLKTEYLYDSVQAHYALAFIPFWRQQWSQARTALLELREIVEMRLCDDQARQYLLESINEDLANVEVKLAETGSQTTQGELLSP